MLSECPSASANASTSLGPVIFAATSALGCGAILLTRARLGSWRCRVALGFGAILPARAALGVRRHRFAIVAAVASASAPGSVVSEDTGKTSLSSAAGYSSSTTAAGPTVVAET